MRDQLRIDFVDYSGSGVVTTMDDDDNLMTRPHDLSILLSFANYLTLQAMGNPI